MAGQEFQANDGWFDWAYKGVDHSFPGNGGPECRDFLSISQRCWESAIASTVALIALIYAYPRLRLPRPSPFTYRRKQEPLGKRLLLLLMCLTFGIELGFKLATRQMIWIGNPCHLATMMQIFILAAPPSRIVTAAFRLHMHMLTGAPIAILFPVINTRLLPFETGVYFLQHILMLVIPFYLMHTGDPFIPEPLSDFSWALVSFGFLFIYHFLPLQFLAYVSQVNLNNMLCPAVSDPFHGRFYRLFAICHQLILILTLGKVFVVIAKAFGILPCDSPEDSGNMSDVVWCETGYTNQRSTCCPSNTCSSNPSRETSAIYTGSEHSTDRDSGCVGSNSASHTQGRSHECSQCSRRGTTSGYGDDHHHVPSSGYGVPSSSRGDDNHRKTSSVCGESSSCHGDDNHRKTSSVCGESSCRGDDHHQHVSSSGYGATSSGYGGQSTGYGDSHRVSSSGYGVPSSSYLDDHHHVSSSGYGMPSSGYGDDHHHSSQCGHSCRNSGVTHRKMSGGGSSNQSPVSVRRIVNGQMVDAVCDEQGCSCRRRGSKDASQDGGTRTSSCPRRSFLLSDQSPSSMDKTLRMSDLEKAKNGHAKAH